MSLTKEMLDSFEIYLDALQNYNQKVNLVADAQPEIVAKRHVLDCLALVDVLNSPQQGIADGTLIDIGSGAGFPGLVLAIACPHLSVVLLESTGKKTRFLESAVERLKLSDRVEVITGRAEDCARTVRRASYDLATSRALGHLAMVAELSMPLLKKGGRLLCQKSRAQVSAEIAALQKFLKPLGAEEPEVIVPAIQVGESEHVIVSIEKRSPTHDKYPRLWAEIIRQWK